MSGASCWCNNEYDTVRCVVPFFLDVDSLRTAVVTDAYQVRVSPMYRYSYRVHAQFDARQRGKRLLNSSRDKHERTHRNRGRGSVYYVTLLIDLSDDREGAGESRSKRILLHLVNRMDTI